MTKDEQNALADCFEALGSLVLTFADVIVGQKKSLEETDRALQRVSFDLAQAVSALRNLKDPL